GHHAVAAREVEHALPAAKRRPELRDHLRAPTRVSGGIGVVALREALRQAVVLRLRAHEGRFRCSASRACASAAASGRAALNTVGANAESARGTVCGTTSSTTSPARSTRYRAVSSENW